VCDVGHRAIHMSAGYCGLPIWQRRRIILLKSRQHEARAVAQTRIVSAARIRLDPRKSVRSFKGIICGDISEFESYMLSHAVVLSQVRKMRSRAKASVLPASG
jgi:hypothetical protein